MCGIYYDKKVHKIISKTYYFANIFSQILKNSFTFVIVPITVFELELQIEEAIHEAEVWKKNLESNFLFEIKEPVRASIKRKNGSTFVEILPKRICETNRMTEKSTFSSKNIHHHDLQAKGPLRDDDQTKDSVCFVPQPKPVQKSVGIPARQLGAKEKYEVSQSVIRAIDAQRGLPEPRFPLNSRQPDGNYEKI